MKRSTTIFAGILYAITAGAVFPWIAAADTMTTSSETTTTTASGTVTEMAPSSSTIVLRSQSSPKPMTYSFSEKTTFVDPSGATVSRESIQNKPVTVYYTQQGDSLVANKVVVTSPSMEKKTTTTTTTEENH